MASGGTAMEEDKDVLIDGEGDHDLEAAARWKVNQQARTILEKVFLQEPLPSKETVNRLAFELHVTTRRVQVWFQNRRQRYTRKGVHKRWCTSARGPQLSAVLPQPAAAAGSWMEAGAAWGVEGLESPPMAGGAAGLVQPLELAAGAAADARQPAGPAAPERLGAQAAGADAPPKLSSQMLLEAQRPFRIMWSSLGWLEQSGYLLQQVLGNTLDMFGGAATDLRALGALVQAAGEQWSEVSGTFLHYTKSGQPFQHVLRLSRLKDSALANAQFILVSSEPAYAAGASRPAGAAPQAKGFPPAPLPAAQGLAMPFPPLMQMALDGATNSHGIVSELADQLSPKSSLRSAAQHAAQPAAPLLQQLQAQAAAAAAAAAAAVASRQREPAATSEQLQLMQQQQQLLAQQQLQAQLQQRLGSGAALGLDSAAHLAGAQGVVGLAAMQHLRQLQQLQELQQLQQLQRMQAAVAAASPSEGRSQAGSGAKAAADAPAQAAETASTSNGGKADPQQQERQHFLMALHESQLAHFARLQQQQQAQFTQWQQMQLAQQQMALQRQLCENAPAILCSSAVGRVLPADAAEGVSSMGPPPLIPAAGSTGQTTGPYTNPGSALPSAIASGGASAGGASAPPAACARAAAASAAPCASAPTFASEAKGDCCSPPSSPLRKAEGARGSSKIDIGSATARFKILSEMNDARAAMQRMTPGPQGQQGPQPGERMGAGQCALWAARAAAKPQLSARKGSGFDSSGGGADGAELSAQAGGACPEGGASHGGSGSSRDGGCNEVDEASVWSWLNNEDMSMIEVNLGDMSAMGRPRPAALAKQRSASNAEATAAMDVGGGGPSLGGLDGVWDMQLDRNEGRVGGDDG